MVFWSCQSGTENQEFVRNHVLRIIHIYIIIANFPHELQSKFWENAIKLQLNSILSKLRLKLYNKNKLYDVGQNNATRTKTRWIRYLPS